MVIKLQTVSALCADVYPAFGNKPRKDADCLTPECSRRQKTRCTSLPALVEDDSEVEMENYASEQRSYIPMRRQKSISPQRRERMRRQLALPSLSEDEEP